MSVFCNSSIWKDKRRKFISVFSNRHIKIPLYSKQMLYNEWGMYLVNCFWHCEAIYFTLFPVFQTYIMLWLSNIINEVVKYHRLKHWNNTLKETMINERKKYDKFIHSIVIEWHWFSWLKDECLVSVLTVELHLLSHLFYFQKGHLLLILYQVVQQYWTVSSLPFVKSFE
jgi:hypothetical protein